MIDAHPPRLGHGHGFARSSRRPFQLVWLLLVTAAMLQPTRGYSSESTERRPYVVVTTVGMITDIVEEVAGELATVHGLIGTGVDPHLYRATRSDVAALIRADVVFYNGLMLEGKMADTLVKVARKGKPVYAVTELLDEQYLLTPKGFKGHHDPHVWMDVGAWQKAVEAVANALSEYDPPNAAGYHSRAQEYTAKLAQLKEYVHSVIQSIPKQQRTLITAHDAFNYFGRANGIDVKGIQGISTESEAGLNDINRLVDLIVRLKIMAVFVETSVADRYVQALIEGAGARGHPLTIGGRLFSDAMGNAGSYEGTYIGMIDHNATLIARGLGGQAPLRGLHGKLKLEGDR